jgi:hypothetical protein
MHCSGQDCCVVSAVCELRVLGHQVCRARLVHQLRVELSETAIFKIHGHVDLEWDYSVRC